jgi:phage protein D
MAEAAVSRFLVVASRPRFEVDDQPVDRLSADLLRLEASEDEEGMARLEAVFLNWGQPAEGQPPGFLYFDGDKLDLGRRIRVLAGDSDNEGVIFEGVITALDASFVALRPPEITVRAEDTLQRLRMRQHTRNHELRDDAGIASAVAGSYGLGADAQVDGPTYASFLQVNQSDLGFLRERARAVDGRIGVSDRALVFHPRREPAQSDPIALSRLNSLIRFEVSADLAHQRTEVRVHGYSIPDKSGIHQSAGAADIRSEVGTGRSGADVLSQAGIDAIEDHHLETPASDEEALAIARSLARRRARRFVSGHGVADGTPSMKVGSRVQLNDLGPLFSGRYYVCRVRHTYDQRDGLRTHFIAERPGLGGDV